MKISNENVDIKNWPRPKSPKIQWKDGRSAKELAQYFVNSFPKLPKEIEDYLKMLGVPQEKKFSLDAEHVTYFTNEFGTGGGRNHDAILWDEDVVVGIEAKADETLDETIEKWLLAKMKNGRSGYNAKKRVNALSTMIFGDNYEKHMSLRYQLLSAFAGVLLEAERKNACKAILLIITFLKEGINDKGKPYYDPKKVQANKKDIEEFMKTLKCDKVTGKVDRKYGTQNNIEAYVWMIEVNVE